MRKQLKTIVLAAILIPMIVIGAAAVTKKAPTSAKPTFTADKDTQACIKCHAEKGIAVDASEQWKMSRHGEAGVGCLECHLAQAGDKDKWEHEGKLITHIPSPKDCAQCHEQEVKEFSNSHHSQAAKFIGSLDNMLGEVVEGGPAANLGCKQCHGSTVQIDAKGKPVAGTWPNTGIGRINPDGSAGSCSACHTRHLFSKAQARSPENCGRCHMGPDHPQLEIYTESKHGINFALLRDKLNLDADEWIVGKDYNGAPTCATCHMSATKTLPVTHDIGARISWTLRPVISKKLENWEKKRADMQSVCLECHGKTWVENYYTMYDNAVELYNTKFGIPAQSIMTKLYESKKLSPTKFDEELEWTFYELWHHEGRRARMGASMMGPDFTQWHGFYEVAKHFYMKFIPEAQELDPNIANDILNSPEHKWKKGMTKEEIEEQLKFYNERYGK